mgnify:CR=1 FL=1
MNRREFTWMMAGATASALVPPVSARTQLSSRNVSAVSRSAAELYRRALVLDCNSGPPWEGGHLPLPQSDLDMVRDSGVDVVKWSIGGINADFVETIKDIAYIQPAPWRSSKDSLPLRSNFAPHPSGR